jgi:hypothetical protein
LFIEGKGQAGEVDGGGQRIREERPERGAHQLRHVPREEAGDKTAFQSISFSLWFGSRKEPHVDLVLVCEVMEVNACALTK